MAFEVVSDKSLEVKTLMEAAKLHDVKMTEELYLKIIDKVYGKLLTKSIND